MSTGLADGGGVALDDSAAARRYRQAEEIYLKLHGLEPIERFVEIQSPAARLRVLEVGSGEPVLFVHGTAGAAPVWAPLVHRMKGFRCLMLDRPGWGYSSPIDYSKSEYRSLTVEVLDGLLDALELEHTHIAGGSIGNVWALALAAARPSRVGRVVLMGGGPLLPEIPVPGIIKVLASPLGAAMVRMPEKRQRVVSITRGNGHGRSLDAGRMEEFIDWRTILGKETPSMRHERDMVRNLVDKQGWRPGLTFDNAELAEIQQPTLYLYGTEDPVGSADIWRGAVDQIPRGELHLLQNFGHMPWLDDPARVASDVEEFLKA